MPKTDPRVDAYIAKAAEFARPILTRVRKLVHRACPDATETIKWGAPFYEHQGILVATPAFKRHCAVIFWKGKIIFRDLSAKANPTKPLRRLTSAAELPADRVMLDYLKQAVALNEAGVKAPARAKAKKRPEAKVPEDLQAALRKNKRAQAAFEKLSPSCRREYVEWITEAKREETRRKRLQITLEWLEQGKSRNWKYE